MWSKCTIALGLLSSDVILNSANKSLLEEKSSLSAPCTGETAPKSFLKLTYLPKPLLAINDLSEIYKVNDDDNADDDVNRSECNPTLFSTHQHLNVSFSASSLATPTLSSSRKNSITPLESISEIVITVRLMSQTTIKIRVWSSQSIRCESVIGLCYGFTSDTAAKPIVSSSSLYRYQRMR